MNKEIPVSSIGESIKNIGKRFINLNLISLVFLLVNAFFQVNETFILKNFFFDFLFYGFGVLVIINILLFAFSFYLGSTILSLSENIKSINIPQKEQVKINFNNIKDAICKSNELLEMKEEAVIVLTLLNPLFLLFFIMSIFSSFIYVFISFLILIF